VASDASDIPVSSRRKSSSCASSNRSGCRTITWKFYHVLLLFAYFDTLFRMALRECRVTFRDVRDIDHSVTVHAEPSAPWPTSPKRSRTTSGYTTRIPDLFSGSPVQAVSSGRSINIKEFQIQETSTAVRLCRVSAPTARNYLGELALLGIGALRKGSPASNQPTEVVLSEEHQWLRTSLTAPIHTSDLEI